MRMAISLAVLLAATFMWAQSNQPSNKNANGQVTVRGCVSKSGGDYVLMKENPAITYQLQSTHGIKLSHYLGQRVEITGTKAETIPTNEDAINGRIGSASPVTIAVNSITTLDRECRNQ